VRLMEVEVSRLQDMIRLAKSLIRIQYQLTDYIDYLQLVTGFVNTKATFEKVAFVFGGELSRSFP